MTISNAIKIAIEGRNYLLYSWESGEMAASSRSLEIRANRALEIKAELIELYELKQLNP